MEIKKTIYSVETQVEIGNDHDFVFVDSSFVRSWRRRTYFNFYFERNQKVLLRKGLSHYDKKMIMYGEMYFGVANNTIVLFSFEYIYNKNCKLRQTQQKNQAKDRSRSSKEFNMAIHPDWAWTQTTDFR